MTDTTNASPENPEPAQAATETPQPPKDDPKPPAGKPDPWDDPAAARAEIERLRRENGAARTNAKQQAADEARNELAQTIGKALGLVADEPIDPADLTESLSAAQVDAKQARVELAVFRNASDAGGDPAALLDSSSFLKSLADVDPSDSEAVKAAIASAIEKNPRLGVVTTPRPPAPNPAQGASASGAPSTSDLAAQAAANGDWRQAASLKAEQLLSLRNATK